MKLACVGFTFCLCCISLLPVASDLLITGGTHKQRALIEITYRYTIPAQFHSTQNVTVQLLDEKSMNSYLDEGSPDQSASKGADDSIDGVYEDGPPLITLRSSMPDDELEYTVAHEYGHYVWQTELTAVQRKQFNRIYSTEKRRGRLVSDYAAFSVNEGFAEAFATYSTCPSMLKAKDPLSFDFIDTLMASASQQPALVANTTATGQMVARD